MQTPFWFDDVTALGELPDLELIERLYILGENEVAEKMEHALASTSPGPTHKFSSGGRQIRENQPWAHSTHVIGYVPLTGTADRLIEIQPAFKIKPDRELLGQRINIGLDGFQPYRYPGGEVEEEDRIYRILFHFSARHFPSEEERLHFNVSHRVKERAPFRYLNQSLFVGLTVGEPGLDLRYLTLPLKDSCDIDFFEALASEIIHRGMKLSPEPQPAAALVSEMAFRTTAKVKRSMEPIEALHMGLGYTSDNRTVPLRTGTYVVAQVPSVERTLFEDEEWAEWRLHLPTGQIVERKDPRESFGFNYTLFTVAHFAPAPRTTGGQKKHRYHPEKAVRHQAESPKDEFDAERSSRTASLARRTELKTDRDSSLTIRVEIDRAKGESRLIYRLDFEPQEIGPPANIVGPPIKRSPDQYQKEFIAEMGDLGQGLFLGEGYLEREVEDRLVSLGRGYYKQFFTGDMRAAYRFFRDKVNILHIVSEEPWIPWELIKPYDNEGDSIVDDDFLCLRYGMTHWPSSTRDVAAPIKINKLAAVHAGRVDGLDRLAKADEEYAMITTLAQRYPDVIDLSLFGDQASKEVVKELLEEADLGLLHVIAHGDFGDDNPEHAGIYLRDKRRLFSSDISGPMTTEISKARPLVFINACLAGRQAFSLTGVGGWASQFINAGCGAFVGPRWSINDNLAFEFAKAFYAALENGATFSNAALEARLELQRNESSSLLATLAPIVHAHPRGKILFR